ncbi:MAG TPA: winged helix-turn-helix domain-containing protein, partial [Actinomycetota bacterium]|nr:winged helix-turn-helix domain-containing protein [Actinomycetota bacterium]
RSETQARVLARLFIGSSDGLSLAELARVTGSASPTIHHEVERLEEAGLVVSKRFGNMRIVSANRQLPYFQELRSILVKTYGPSAVLQESLEGIQGIEEASIFGSWASRHQGRRGPAPADVDLLVIGEPDPEEIYEACRRAEKELATQVNPTILTRNEWAHPKTGFVKQVKKGPRVLLIKGRR